MILWPLPDQRHLYMLIAGVVLGLLLGPTVMGRFAPRQYDQFFVGSGDMSKVEEAVQARDTTTIEDFDLDTLPEVEAAKHMHGLRTRNLDLRIKNIELQFEASGLEGGSPATTGLKEQVAQLKAAKQAEDAKLKTVMINAVNSIQPRLQAQVEQATAEVQARRALHQSRLLAMSMVMVLLVAVLFAAESILSPQRDEIEGGHATLHPALSRLVTIRYGLAAGWLMLMLAQPTWLRQIDPWFGGLLLAVVLVAGLVPLGKRAEASGDSAG